jgi:hypothetical protein
MRTVYRLSRLALGGLLVAHALAHAVLPLRGAIDWAPASIHGLVPAAAYCFAVVALFVAGLGVLGSAVFSRHAEWLFGAGLVASFTALIFTWNAASRPALVLNVVVFAAFMGARASGLVVIGPPAKLQPRHWSTYRWSAEIVACALVAYVAIAAVAWPGYRHWGSSDAERRMPLPGDPAVRTHRAELTHAVTIDAPPEAVWPWLLQLGQDRAGFYSYDWLERLFLVDVHNVREIRPEWQQRAAGDLVRAVQPDYLGGLFGRNVGWRVTELQEGRAIVLEHWGAFVLEPASGGRTRFLIRSTIGGPQAPAWGAGLTLAAFELPHFIMERRMMLTIKACAEGRCGAGGA